MTAQVSKVLVASWLYIKDFKRPNVESGFTAVSLEKPLCFSPETEQKPFGSFN